MEFYYAKLNIIAKMNAQITLPRREFFKEALSNSKSDVYRNAGYQITDVGDVNINGNDYVYGYILKYKDVLEDVFNEQNKKVGQTLVRNKILSTTMFVINLEENIVLYNENKTHLSRASFLERFTNLLSQGLRSTFLDIQLYPISDNYTFYHKLLTIPKITEISLTLYPTNPSAEEEIEQIDKLMKEENLKSKTIIYKGRQDEGIKIDEEIKGNSMFTDVGYGKGRAEGYDDNGHFMKIYSTRTEKQKKTSPFNVERDPGDIIKDLDDILEREKKK